MDDWIAPAEPTTAASPAGGDDWVTPGQSSSKKPFSWGTALSETWPARIAKDIWSGVTLPHDVYQGKVDPLSDEGIARATSAATTMLPVGPEARIARTALRTTAPTNAELKASATAGYESPVVKGVQIASEAAPRLADEIRANMAEIGVHPVLAPKTHAIIDDLYKVPDNSFMTVDGLRALRRTLGNAAASPDATERLAAKSAQSHIDEFLSGLSGADVIAGDPQAASTILKQANANYAAMKRASELDARQIRAELRAAATNSGMNVGNTIRQRMADILATPRLARGFSPDELTMMRGIVEGSTTGNAARYASNILGGGGGLLAGLYGLGHMAVAPIAGYMLRRAANSQTMRSAEKLNEAVRARSPLAQEPRYELAEPSALKRIAPRGEGNVLPEVGVTSVPARAEDENNRRRGGRVAQKPDGNAQRKAHGGKITADLPYPQGRAAGGRVIAHNINPDPTEAQKEAGNYAKDHVRVHGLDITIENVKGSERSGVGKGGKSWSVPRMPAHYGYIKRTEGKDGDHVDCYLGPHLKSPNVFIVDQLNADSRKFDEHKCFIGFASKQTAINAYHKAFSDGRGHERLGHVTEMDIDQFKHWLGKGDTTRPADDHQAVNIVRKFDVPYLAGASNDGKTIYIDRRVPLRIKVRLASGKGFRFIDPAKPLSIHEIEEWKAMTQRKMPYLQAHTKIATPAEHEWLTSHGLDWGEYEKVMDGLLSSIEHEHPVQPPPDLYTKPYSHDKAKLLKKLEKEES